MRSDRLSTLIISCFLLLALPKMAAAHALNAPAELIVTLLQGHQSGPFEISATQYATAEFTELEVQLSVFGATLPEDASVAIVAISAETDQQFTAHLIRHHNAFTTTLPLITEDWHVSISVASSAGAGEAETTITPYRAPLESAPIIRYLTFSAPFLLMVFVLLGMKLCGISLMPANK